MIFYTLGQLLKVEALLLLLPVVVSLIYQEKAGIYYAAVAVVVLIIGFAISRKVPENKTIYAKEGFFIVGVSWILLSLFGAIPFVLAGDIPHYVDAFFETVSGFTTTGSSILVDIDALSHASLFWRSFTHWVGGMGVLVFTAAFLPISSGRTLHILRAEMPGPIVGKLVSKIKVTARILYILYGVMTIVQVILLCAGGMSLFYSLLNTFGTAGTGGFSVSNAGIAGYNSPYIEGVITVFMILFGINFNVIYLAVIGKFMLAFRDEEVRWYLGIIAAAILAITVNISSMYHSYVTAFRYAAFQVASIITTTGYTTADYDKWPQLSQMILLLIMFVGACAGSTGGGIKVSRIVMMGKHALQEIKKILHPHSVSTVKFEGVPVSDKTMNNMHAYLVLYFLLFSGSLLIVSFDNLDFQSTFSAVATCINNVGPAFRQLGPTDNFFMLSGLSKVVLSFAMLAGRLEIFPMLVLFSRSFWKE